MIEITKDDTPLDVATKLIEGRYEEEVLTFRLKHKYFDTGELEQIARHLLVYVEGQREEEDGYERQQD